MLGNETRIHGDADDHNLRTRYRVLDNIALNVANTAASDPSPGSDVWKLTLEERHLLLEKWKQEIDPQTILDRTAEIHRRHQAAVLKRHKVYHEHDARCLQDRKEIGRKHIIFSLIFFAREHYRDDYDSLRHEFFYAHPVRHSDCYL